MDWFRFYHDALHNAKVDSLDGETYKRWVKLLCLASQQPVRGVLPDVQTVAYQLRIPLDQAKDLIKKLRRERLIDAQPGSSAGAMHNWNRRQRQSDDPAERKRRSRDARRTTNKEVTESSRDQNVTTHARGPDTDTDTETDSESQSHHPPAGLPPRAGRGELADALWKAIQDACGKPTTKSAIQRRVEVCRELRDAGATPAQVALRATEWTQRYSVPLTDKALASHWGELAEAFVPTGRNGKARPNGQANPHAVQDELYRASLAAASADRKALTDGPH